MINNLRLLKRRILTRRDDFVAFSKSWVNELFPGPKRKEKPRILIYHIHGLSYAGTQKGLQFIAKHLSKEKYDVYYMFGERPGLFPGSGKKEDLEVRKQELLNAGVSLIRADFDKTMGPPAHVAKGINPSPRDVVKALDIDLFITAGMGYASYPIPILRCPCILIDVFGYGTTLSKKVRFILPISDTVKRIIDDVVPEEKIITLPWAVPRPPSNLAELGMEFRKKYGISGQTLVFGRIGRSVDTIFDPIAIYAFEKTIKDAKGDCLYLIVGPSAKLKQIVDDRKIPSVLSIDSLASDEDVWAFHGAIDVLAHYRLDGESLGVNIIETIAAGNPVITHESRRWNAHLEYLSDDFAFVADVDSVDQYASFMEFCVRPDNRHFIRKMGQHAKATYEQRFSEELYMDKLETVIKRVLMEQDE